MILTDSVRILASDPTFFFLPGLAIFVLVLSADPWETV
jgi:ABC-type dipeptide/oligopeptide/nickel transport system permease subunit